MGDIFWVPSRVLQWDYNKSEICGMSEAWAVITQVKMENFVFQPYSTGERRPSQFSPFRTIRFHLLPIFSCNFLNSVCLPLWWSVSRLCFRRSPVHDLSDPKFVCPSCNTPAQLHFRYGNPFPVINDFRLLLNPLIRLPLSVIPSIHRSMAICATLTIM